MTRIFAISDLHVDYAENNRWVGNLSRWDYQDDILILAGDVSDLPHLLSATFEKLEKCFQAVLYVPGNHDLWVRRSGEDCSFAKFDLIHHIAAESGVKTRPYNWKNICMVPLYSWYDFSFGSLDQSIARRWTDFKACRWSGNYDAENLTSHFHQLNESIINNIQGSELITFSHFMPRIDLMPDYIPPKKRLLYPVLGSTALEQQIRQLEPQIHVYGHSHVNRTVSKEGCLYINNAFGYAHEKKITRKELLCIAER